MSGHIGVGGLAGYNSGTTASIHQSYATGNVSGSSHVGGLVGRNTGTSVITNSYSIGSVTAGGAGVGGLLGSIGASATVVNSYWDIETSGRTNSSGSAGTFGLTTAQMQQRPSFVGWDIGNTGGTATAWRIYEGLTAPLLRSFMAPLTVRANGGGSLVYDGNAYSGGNGVTWAGFRTGEDVNNLSGALVYGGNAQGAINAGSYAITPTGVYSGQLGYDIIAVSGALTITPRDITVTADAASRAYGNANPTFTYTIGGNGLINGDTLAGALTSVANVTSNVGNYAITQGTLSANSNYNITSYTGADLSVTQRSITVTADAMSRVYGNANPAFTYTVGGDGLVNGDTLSGALASVATATSDVGDYAITQGSVVGGTNYNITSYTGADLSVTERNLIISAQNKTKLLNQANPTLTYTLGGQGLANGDTVSGSLFTAASLFSLMGDYAITQGSVTVSSPANYAVTFNAGTLTITPFTPLITTIETGRTGNSSMTTQQSLVNTTTTSPEIALVTGSNSSSGDFYNIDITQQDIIINPDGSPGLNERKTNASEDFMQSFYQVFFTKELLAQIGYRQ